MKKKLLVLLLVVFVSFLLSGCYKNNDIKETGTLVVSSSFREAIDSGYNISKIEVNLINKESHEGVHRNLSIDEISKTAEVKFDDLKVGEWEVAINVFDSKLKVGSILDTVLVQKD